MKGKTPALIFKCLLLVLALYLEGYLAPVDLALSDLFDSCLAPLSSTASISGPMPREVALRRVVDKTDTLLRSEGRVINRERLLEIARIADRAGLEYRLPPSLIFSVIHTESHFRPHAVSDHGAIGLMQVQLATAKHFAATAGLPKPTGFRLFEPETNILLGAGYLRHLIDRFDGNLGRALAAYHVGPTEIDRRIEVGEPYSNRYGNEIRVREVYATTTAPSRPVTPAPVSTTVRVSQENL